MTGETYRPANDESLTVVLARVERRTIEEMKHARLAKPDPEIVLIEWLCAATAALMAAPPVLRQEYDGLQTWFHIAAAIICTAFALIYQFTPRLWRVQRTAATRARRRFSSIPGRGCVGSSEDL